MEQKTLRKRFPLWKLPELERLLDEYAADGWRLTAAARGKLTFTAGARPMRHRVDYLDARRGGAEAISYFAAAQAAGWELLCDAGKWVYFAKSPDDAARTGDRLPGDRDRLRLLAGVRILRAERWRRAELILAALLLVVGYATTFWILRAAVLPLVAMIGHTYYLKYLNQAFADET